MRTIRTRFRSHGFTLVEMLVVMGIIGILAAMLMPALNLGKMRATRVVCLNNLRQTGLGFQMFLHDHNSQLPMQVPLIDGGCAEYVQAGLDTSGQFYFGYSVFQTLTGDGVIPALLDCPSDLDRESATNMASLQNYNLSYFAGVNARYDQPNSLLAGDRNIIFETSSTPTIQCIQPGNNYQWTSQLHRLKGDVLIADGHVEEWNQQRILANNDGLNMQSVVFLPTVWVPASPYPYRHALPPRLAHKSSAVVADAPTPPSTVALNILKPVTAPVETYVHTNGWMWLLLLLLVFLVRTWHRLYTSRT